MRTPIRIAAIAGVLSLVALGGSASAVTGAIYDAIPSPQPSNLPSEGFQATQTAEFGDDIAFAAGDRNLQTVNVYMSSWACQAGSWDLGNCATVPGATFTHPITLRLYAVTHVGGVATGAPVLGAVLKSVSGTFTIPYRPSSDPAACQSSAAPGGWSDSAGNCKNGFGFVISFNMAGFVVPDEIVYGISYNTMSYGAAPIGVTGPYDSLNVGVAPQAGGVGTDVAPDIAFRNVNGGGFAPEGGWAGDTVAAQFITVPPVVATTTTTVVAAGGPVPTTVATGVLASSGALPTTGGSSTGGILLASLFVAVGLGLALKARRTDRA